MEDFAAIFSKLPHLDLSGQVEDIQPIASCLGPSCEVFKGHWKNGNKTVAVKRLRVFLTKEERVVKKLVREVYIWSKLDHKNVLPLLGFFLEGGEFPNLISEWMVRGTLFDYMSEVPRGAGTIEMAMGIAKGLSYLHDNDVVHADLKSPNVLISPTLEPLLADFGVSHILTASMSQMCGTSMAALKGTVRWMAVELLTTEAIPNEKSDVWAFGMELLKRTLPYSHLTTEQKIILAISKGQLPERPSPGDRKNFSRVEGGLWEVCGNCWKKKPDMRPSMRDLVCDIVALEEGRPRPRRPRKLDDIRISASEATKIAPEQSGTPGDSVNALIPASVASVSVLPCIFSADPGLSEQHVMSVPKELKKEGSDWVAVFNPDVNRHLDVHLEHQISRTWTIKEGQHRNCARFSSDGRVFAIASGRVDIYDTKTGEIMQVVESAKLDIPLGVIHSVCFSPCTKYLAVGGNNNQSLIWDIEKKCIRRIVKSGQAVTDSLAFSPDGRFIVLGSSADKGKTTHICDVESGHLKTLESMRRGDINTGVTSVAISLDSKFVAAGCNDMTLRVWDVATGDLIERLLGHLHIVSTVAFTPDGKGLVSGSYNGTIKYWDITPVAGSSANRGFIQPSKVTSAWLASPSTLNDAGNAFESSRRYTATKEDGQCMSRCTRTIKGNGEAVHSIAVSDDNLRLISACSGTINTSSRVVDFRDHRAAEVLFRLKLPGDIQANKTGGFYMDMSPQGDRFATASFDEIRIWRVTTYTPA